jgi:tetratricopeptide (TPR) repeat protein
MFVFIVIYLILAYRRRQELVEEKRLGQAELSLLLGLLVAYFVQNLAVFDSFATYLYFFSFLAYIYFIERNYRSLKTVEKDEKKMEKKYDWLKKTAIVILFILIAFSLNKNINSMSMIKKTIDAYAVASKLGIVEANDYYAKVFSYHTGLERDARESFLNLALDSSNKILQASDKKKAGRTIEMMIEASERNVLYNQYDSLMLMRLSKVYDLAARFYYSVEGDSEKGSEYGNLALNALDRAIESSPERIPLYLTRSNMYLNFNEIDKALADMKKAQELNPRMPDSYCQMAHLYFIEKDHSKFIENFSACGERKGFSLLNWSDFLNGIESKYYQNKEYDKLIETYNTILKYQVDDINILSKMALIYYESGNNDMAEKTAKRLVEIDPSYQSEVDAFIEKIKE